MQVETRPMAQWQEALEQGNRVRLQQSKLKKELKGLPQAEGLAIVADLLERGDMWLVGAMRVGALLLACQRMGESKMTRLLVTAQCSSSRRVRDLTERQRVAIATSIRVYGS